MPESAKITTLCENTVPVGGLLAEQGLSFFIEADGQKILFDTGSGLTLAHNTKKLKIDLSQVDAIALSHGHYDHTGGLEHALSVTGPVDVYGHPGVLRAKYRAVEGGGEPRYNGIPKDRAALECLGARFHLSEGRQDLGDGVWLTGAIPRRHAFEVDQDSRLRFLKEEDGSFVPDPLWDDQVLVLETPRGLVVVSGCAHSGIVNVLDQIDDLSGGQGLYALVGGLHLRESGPERLERTAAALAGRGLARVGVSHCTGFKAASLLWQRFGDAFFENNVSAVFTV